MRDDGLIRFFSPLSLLDDNGVAFSCPPRDGNPAMIAYRPHETWTSRVDWRTPMPEGEHIIGKL